VGSLGTALLPAIFRSARRDLLRHERLFRFISRLTWAVFLWLALCLSLTAQPLTRLLYGREFITAAPAMALLVWCIPPIALTYLISSFFTAVEKQHYLIYVWAAALVTNVGANLALTYKLGIMGAAASMCISSVALCGTLLFLVHWRLGLRAEWGKQLVLMCSCALAWSISRILLPESPALSALAATVIYFTSAFATGTLGVQEVALVRELVRHR